MYLVYSPTQDMPSQDSLTQESPTQDSPTQDSPTQHPPPNQDSLTQDSPTQDSPAQDSPAQLSLTQDLPAQDSQTHDAELLLSQNLTPNATNSKTPQNVSAADPCTLPSNDLTTDQQPNIPIRFPNEEDPIQPPAPEEAPPPLPSVRRKQPHVPSLSDDASKNGVRNTPIRGRLRSSTSPHDP